MQERSRSFRRLLQLLACVWIALAAGCHSYRTVDVQILDIETRQPIAGAVVSTQYWLFMDLAPPPTREDVSDSEGKVRIKIARGWENRVRLSCEARDYAPGEYITPGGSRIAPGMPPVTETHLRSTERNDWPSAMVIEKWRSPWPTFAVIVPADYRGPIRIEIDNQKVVDLAPGQRRVELHVTDGVLRVPLTRPILIGFSANDWEFAYADGRAIPSALRSYRDPDRKLAGDDEIAVRSGGVLGVMIGTNATVQTATRPAH